MLIEEILAIKQKCNLENEIARVYNLSGKEMECILALSRAGELSSKELASRIDLSPSRCSRIIGRLMEEGLVQGVPHREDRRFLELSLTPGGLACRDGLEEEKKMCEQRLFASLSARQIADIRKGLNLLLKAL